MKKMIGLVLLLCLGHIVLIICASAAVVGAQTLPSPGAITSAYHVSPIVSVVQDSNNLFLVVQQRLARLAN